MESKKYELNSKDGKKILLGAGVAIGGALVTYLSEVVPNVDWGLLAPAVTALASVLVNLARKWLAGR